MSHDSEIPSILHILGQPVEIPLGIERVRLSIGALANLTLPTEEGEAAVLLLNLTRLKKGIPEYGLIGGATKFNRNMTGRREFQQLYGIEDGQFEPEKPLDIRISNLPISQIATLTETVVRDGYIDPVNDVYRELKEEMAEMSILSQLSEVLGTITNFRGRLPGLESIHFTHTTVFPIQVSQRSGEPSLRVQTVCTVTPTQDLDAYIRQHATMLRYNTLNVATPFILVPPQMLGWCISHTRTSVSESVLLHGIMLGSQEIRVSGLVRALK